MKSNQNLSKGLIIQFILLIGLIILMFLSIKWKELLPYADILAGVIALVMAYNKKDDKKYIPISLIIFGILFIFLGGYSFING